MPRYKQGTFKFLQEHLYSLQKYEKVFQLTSFYFEGEFFDANNGKWLTSPLFVVGGCYKHWFGLCPQHQKIWKNI